MSSTVAAAAIKTSLSLAAAIGDTGSSLTALVPEADSGWAKGGLEHLYFDHPTSKNALGTVEIDTSAPVHQVRVELFVPPALAVEVIKMVMSAEIPEDVRVEETPAEPVAIERLFPTKDPTSEEEEDEDDGLPPEVLSGYAGGLEEETSRRTEAYEGETVEDAVTV